MALTFKQHIAMVMLLVFSQQLRALPDVQVQGLFAGRAMLSIDGNVQLLKEGETSPEGITLVSADSKQAVISYDGEKHQLALSAESAPALPSRRTGRSGFDRTPEATTWLAQTSTGTTRK